MKITVYLIICLILAGCSQSKSAYETQKDLDAYLGKTTDESLTELTAVEEQAPLVILNYQISAVTTELSGIKQLSAFNSGKVFYWIHVRTTRIKSSQQINLPGPFPALLSSIDILIRVITKEGTVDYNNQTFGTFLSRFEGSFFPDYMGNPEIRLKNVPEDTEIEYTLNQKLNLMPFFISIVLPESRIRTVGINLDSGNEATRGTLLPDLPFVIEDRTVEKPVNSILNKKKVTPNETFLLPQKCLLTLPSGELLRPNRVKIYFPIGNGLTDIPNDSEASSENFYRNFVLPVSELSDRRKSELLIKLKGHFELGNSFLTDLSKIKPESRLDSFQVAISNKLDWNSFDDDLWDPWVSQFWPEIVPAAVTVLWVLKENLKNCYLVSLKKSTGTDSLSVIHKNGQMALKNQLTLLIQDRPIK